MFLQRRQKTDKRNQCYMLSIAEGENRRLFKNIKEWRGRYTSHCTLDTVMYINQGPEPAITTVPEWSANGSSVTNTVNLFVVDYQACQNLVILTSF